MIAKRIFIDTNIYLDFYRSSGYSLDTLESLIEIIKEKKIELILPKQVINEFGKNKEEVFTNFIEQNFRNIKNPGFIDSKKIERLNTLLNKIEDDYQRKFFSPRSKINIKVKKLFDMAVVPKEKNQLLNLAYYRTLRGNPPRNNNKSFGDAIIWETLLNGFSDKDMIIISRDKDFSSKRNQKEIHPLLEEEWKTKKNKKISVINTLGEAINIITDKKTVKKEVIQEEKIYNRYDNISKTLELNDVVSVPVNNFHLDTAPNSLSIDNDRDIFANSMAKKNQISVGTFGRCVYCGELNIDKDSPCRNCGRLSPRLQSNN